MKATAKCNNDKKHHFEVTDIKSKIKNAVSQAMQEYFEQDGEALDGDEVDDIIRALYFELNLANGNITGTEYVDGLEKCREIIIASH